MRFGFSGALHRGGVEDQKKEKVKLSAHGGLSEPLGAVCSFINTGHEGYGARGRTMLSGTTHLICVWNIDLTAS